jgi:hypothetical protein
MLHRQDQGVRTTGLDLYWLPLGAGGQSVRFNGRVFEAVAARWQHRPVRDLYHSALELRPGLSVRGAAIESPRRLTGDPSIVRRVRDLVPSVPTPVWGRDELGAGEMWNSNSVTSWLITRAGLPVDSIDLPAGGRAPGWNPGIVVARRRE